MSGPTLKLVVAWSERRNLCSLVRDALASFDSDADVLPLGDDATVMYTELTADAVRDRLRGALDQGDNLLVTEFEVWSSYGGGVDVGWLLGHGH